MYSMTDRILHPYCLEYICFWNWDEEWSVFAQERIGDNDGDRVSAMFFRNKPRPVTRVAVVPTPIRERELEVA